MMVRASVIGPVLRALLPLALLAGCGGDDHPAEPALASRVELSAPKTRIEVGEPLTITAVARDARDSVILYPVVVWSATPAAVASVTGGAVTAIAPGTVIVQATAQSASASIVVDVVSAATASLVVSAPAQSLVVGASVTVHAIARDARQAALTDRAVTFSSSDTRAVVVNDAGVATAVASGSAFVVARSDGVRDSLLLTVSGATAPTLVLSPAAIELPLGRAMTLAVRTRDADGALTIPSGVTWSSDNAQVASVNGGVVTGLAAGNTIVRAQAGTITAAASIHVGTGGVTYAVGIATIADSVIRADSINISGALTASGPLTLISSGDIVVTGGVFASCHALTLLAAGRVILTHSALNAQPALDNACAGAVPPGPAPGIRIEAAGGYRVAFSNIRSTGNITITNDAALLLADFTTSPPHRANDACVLITANIDHAGMPATAGGSAARDGARIEIDCRGTLRAAFANINASGGGIGGSSVQPSSALGGDGGRAGSVRLRVTGDVIVDQRRLYLRVFGPGNGGNATSTQAGADGANATAIGGRGGDMGAPDRPPVEFRVAGDVIDNDPAPQNVIEIGLFISGRGGDAVANGAAGRIATAQKPAGAGGAATAIAGQGGNVYPSIVIVRGALPEGALWLLGQPANAGGSATAVGGAGGTGSSEYPHGGPGGAARADGGDGGTTLGVNSREGTPPRGGDGGTASLSGGNGGNGFDRCGSTGLGGIGGAGGTMSGSDGRAGTGQTNGISLGIRISDAANGGVGGRGVVPGLGGRAGNDATQARGPRTVTPPSFVNGAAGGACPAS